MKKVVSLETAKLLVEKGIVLKTKSGFVCGWSDKKEKQGWQVKKTSECFETLHVGSIIPAPDIPELLAELPYSIVANVANYYLFITKRVGGWIVCYADECDDFKMGLGSEFDSEELVEALAQALIWVKSREVSNENI